MAYIKQSWGDYDDTKSEAQNAADGAVVTADRMNHMENGIANAVDKLTFDKLEDDSKAIGVQLSERAIVESGGNEADGYYTKYGNGDIEFWGKIDLYGTFSTGSVATFTKTLPFSCVNPVQVVLTGSMYDGSGAFSDFRAGAYRNGSNVNGFFGHVRCEFAASTQSYMGVHYQGKGRWK